MSWQAAAWATEQQIVTSPTQRHVLLALANYAGVSGANAFPSVARLARDTGLTPRAVQKSLRALEAAGAIRRGNQRVVEAEIDRADLRPVNYDICMDRPAATAANGANEVHPDDGTGRTSRPNGVNLTPERGERGSPEPSDKYPLTARARGAAPDGAPRGDAKPRGEAATPDDRERRRRYGLKVIRDWLRIGDVERYDAMALGVSSPPAGGYSGEDAERFIAALPASMLSDAAGLAAWASRLARGEPDKDPPPPGAPVGDFIAAVRSGLTAEIGAVAFAHKIERLQTLAARARAREGGSDGAGGDEVGAAAREAAQADVSQRENAA